MAEYLDEISFLLLIPDFSNLKIVIVISDAVDEIGGGDGMHAGRRYGRNAAVTDKVAVVSVFKIQIILQVTAEVPDFLSIYAADLRNGFYLEVVAFDFAAADVVFKMNFMIAV